MLAGVEPRAAALPVRAERFFSRSAKQGAQTTWRLRQKLDVFE